MSQPGAPHKIGLIYFSHDTNMSSDPRIEYLEAETGLEGYAIYNKLLEKIYQDKGYYIKFDQKRQKLLSNKINIELDKLVTIANVCLQEGLFHKELYDNYSILTSESIQRRYLRITERRKEIPIIREFFLVNNNSINDNINFINVDNNSINVDII